MGVGPYRFFQPQRPSTRSEGSHLRLSACPGAPGLSTRSRLQDSDPVLPSFWPLPHGPSFIEGLWFPAHCALSWILQEVRLKPRRVRLGPKVWVSRPAPNTAPLLQNSLLASLEELWCPTSKARRCQCPTAKLKAMRKSFLGQVPVPRLFLRKSPELASSLGGLNDSTGTSHQQSHHRSASARSARSARSAYLGVSSASGQLCGHLPLLLVTAGFLHRQGLLIGRDHDSYKEGARSGVTGVWLTRFVHVPHVPHVPRA